jgi:hypothetical protein
VDKNQVPGSGINIPIRNTDLETKKISGCIGIVLNFVTGSDMSKENLHYRLRDELPVVIKYLIQNALIYITFSTLI